MRFQDFISSKPVTRLGIVLGQYMPRRMGYGLARIAAGIIARRKPEVYWTVRANLRQILGPEADDATLHRMTHQVFFHAGQTYYDFFHAIGQPKEVLAEAVPIPDEILAFARSETARGQGVLVLVAHMSNFDLLGLSMGARDLPIQMLSLADPQAGFHLLNYLRATAGFEVTPVRLPHYTLETYGFRVARDGATIAYSGDSGPSDRLAELARNVDLFVCEATLLHGDFDGQPRGHLSLEEALDSHRASGARRLLVTHRPSELPTDAGLELAYDGLELELGRSADATA